MAYVAVKATFKAMEATKRIVLRLFFMVLP
jgi:hypothetical protein